MEYNNDFSMRLAEVAECMLDIADDVDSRVYDPKKWVDISTKFMPVYRELLNNAEKYAENRRVVHDTFLGDLSNADKMVVNQLDVSEYRDATLNATDFIIGDRFLYTTSSKKLVEDPETGRSKVYTSFTSVAKEVSYINALANEIGFTYYNELVGRDGVHAIRLSPGQETNEYVRKLGEDETPTNTVIKDRLSGEIFNEEE